MVTYAAILLWVIHAFWVLMTIEILYGHFTNKQTYRYHNLKPMPDEACMGLFMFNLKMFSNKTIY